ncbi:hypothetical protein [Spirosoma endophyticum]|uniref:Uncharacterized protein n=1 Tax=Spirosoma endophyticum TaxID=662367 RepID=A0A1I1M0R6_9BACT|nr:hypothetical protein [Spirosoma endophyticum]SFC78342.1 hypothetical protein SAMN05216167_102399 [Spirosoma endophyticum]
MNTLKWLVGLVLSGLAMFPSYGQFTGMDPAVTQARILPTVAAGVGAPISMTFTIGNNGDVAISGANEINQMGFNISLGKCGAVPDGLGALSSNVFTYFDVIYVDQGNGYFGFIGQQKTGVDIPAHTLIDVVISATVTQATNYSSLSYGWTGDIGASCNIIPSPTSLPEPSGNNFQFAYTRTPGQLPSDLVPIISALPSTQYGTTDFSVVVDVFELNSLATNGLIKVYLTKDPMVPLSFNPNATLVGGKLVQNDFWTFDDSYPDLYVFSTQQVIQAGGKKSFGLTGVLNPNNTRGSLTISSALMAGSGGEITIKNNSDADKIDYFKK